MWRKKYPTLPFIPKPVCSSIFCRKKTHLTGLLALGLFVSPFFFLNQFSFFFSLMWPPSCLGECACVRAHMCVRVCICVCLSIRVLPLLTCHLEYLSPAFSASLCCSLPVSLSHTHLPGFRLSSLSSPQTVCCSSICLAVCLCI